MTGHFLKTVVVFTIMIILGLVGVVILNYVDKKGGGETYKMLSTGSVAK